MIQTVLIVCIGNICRSPIGEGVLHQKLQSSHPDVRVHSAGLHAMCDCPASSVSVALMQDRQIDISGHRARQISPDMVYGSDLILTMTTDQQLEIEQKYSGTKGRVHRIGHWGGYDVPDPYQRPQVVYEQALALIEQGVNDWYERLWN